jgi:hypothetical protein
MHVVLCCVMLLIPISNDGEIASRMALTAVCLLWAWHSGLTLFAERRRALLSTFI